MTEFARKILIGTASFGSRYGIANISELKPDDVKDIIKMARAFEILGVDTARQYEGSEQVLGESGLDGLQVFTKFKHETELSDLDGLKAQIKKSAAKLRVQQLQGVSPHTFKDFVSSGSSGSRNLSSLKAEGLIHSWGLSLYEPEEFELALRIATPDFIQFPMNFFDRRFEESGVLQRANDQGIAIQARSIFLQGVLLENPTSLPPYFSELSVHLKEVKQTAESLGLGVASFLLLSALQDERIQQVVVGVNSKQQMKEIEVCLTSKLSGESFEMQNRTTLSAEILDPRRWPR